MPFHPFKVLWWTFWMRSSCRDVCRFSSAMKNKLWREKKEKLTVNTATFLSRNHDSVTQANTQTSSHTVHFFLYHFHNVLPNIKTWIKVHIHDKTELKTSTFPCSGTLASWISWAELAFLFLLFRESAHNTTSWCLGRDIAVKVSKCIFICTLIVSWLRKGKTKANISNLGNSNLNKQQKKSPEK